MDEELEDIPDAKTCQERVEQFAEITGTDEACAQFYLQDRQWDLDRSINAYFETKQNSGLSLMANNDSEDAELFLNVDEALANQLATVPAVPIPLPKSSVRPISHSNLEPSIKPPPELTFVTWNIDGLDKHNLKKRTKAVCQIIFKLTPDIVFLQEVVPETFSYIEDKLPEYHCIAGGDDTAEYFTATLLRKFTIYYDKHRVIPYPSSLMGRNLLITEAHVGTLKLSLLNSHLESTVEHSSERVKQLSLAIKEAMNVPSNHSVILAGDFNLRDREVTGVLPDRLMDLWEAGGSRPECRYTWDLTRNTNLSFPGKFRPRCRFDRAYLRHSSTPQVRPKFFGLIGLEKVSGTQSFPSDHWGILVHFDILMRESASGEVF